MNNNSLPLRTLNSLKKYLIIYIFQCFQCLQWLNKALWFIREIRPIHVIRVLLLFCVLSGLVFLCGCQALQRKFIRKPKKAFQPPIVAVKEYQDIQYSNEDMYRQHFAYWQAYQNDVVVSLQENLVSPINYKRVAMMAEGANKELNNMKGLVYKDMGERLSEFIAEQSNAISFIGSGMPSFTHIVNLGKVFEKNSRIIGREFAFDKAQKYIIQ